MPRKRTTTQVIRQEGFTLIEVLLVVVIIGILVGVAMPRLGGKVLKAQKAAAKGDIRSLGLALDMYEVDNGVYPTSLEGLISKQGNASNWDGPYMKEGIPKDPWGNAYIYSFPGSHHSHGYDLQSLGQDGVGSADDITNWSKE